jgi:hypothetical protein
LPTVLIAVPTELQGRLQKSIFWRSDMRRTFAAPAEVYAVARTLGPDVIIVMPDGPTPDVHGVLQQLRREVVTRDSIVVVLSEQPVQSSPSLTENGANVVLPYDFAEAADESSSWSARLEELLRLKQRRENRVIADFPALLWIGAGSARRRVEARTLNLSSRGVLLDVPEALPLHSKVDLQFRARPDVPEVSVVGEVVRTAETADRRKLAGVHFVVVRKEARLAIRDTLRALRPPGSAPDPD